MEKSLKVKLSYGILLLLTSVLFLVGSFKDQQISKSLFFENNLFSIPMTVIGIFPTFCFGIFSASIIAFAPKRKNKHLTRLQRAIGFLAIILITFFYFLTGKQVSDFSALKRYETQIDIIMGIGLSIFSIVITFFTYRFKDKLKQENLFKFAVIILSSIALFSLFSEIIKYLSSRPRPVLVFDGKETYREWYQWIPFYGFKNSFSKSFVSGHAGNSVILVTALPLFISLTRLGERKNASFISLLIGALIGMLTALSRVLGGQHYVSDVSAGLLLSVLIQILSLLIVDKISIKLKN